MLKDIFYDSLKISKFTRVCMEVTGWQELIFPYTNPSNFRRPLRRLHLRYKVENSRIPNFNMLFQFLLPKLFKSDLFSCL